jgi:hypothetical protein
MNSESMFMRVRVYLYGCGKIFLWLVSVVSVCVLAFVYGLVGVLGCVQVWFGALSMLLKVTFNVGKSDV